jgi:hypothetical protein
MDNNKEIRKLVREVLEEFRFLKSKESKKMTTPHQKRGKNLDFKGYKFGIKDTSMDLDNQAPQEEINFQKHINFDNNMSLEEKKEKFKKILNSLDLTSLALKELENLNTNLISIGNSKQNNDITKKELEQITKKAKEILNKNSISSADLKKWFKIV